MKTQQKKLTRSFYTRNVLTVAKELLGKIFVKVENGNKILSGYIVEVEAYKGKVDQAAHSYKGKTKRNEVMFEEGGHLYVYFTYGVHFCANVVTGKKNEGDAVLIRAIEPVEGLNLMAERRFGKTELNEKEKINLTNGPAKICQAFNLGRKENGEDLTGGKIYLLDRPKIPTKEIIKTKRIGIKKSTGLLWRFYIKNNSYISKR